MKQSSAAYKDGTYNEQETDARAERQPVQAAKALPVDELFVLRRTSSSEELGRA